MRKYRVVVIPGVKAYVEGIGSHVEGGNAPDYVRGRDDAENLRELRRRLSGALEAVDKEIAKREGVK